jgi:hypothetical protein
MRLETEEHMDTLVRTLGPTSVMRNRVKHPKVGFTHQSGTRSVLNQVNSADNETDEGATFKCRTTNRGFDICSDGDIARLYIFLGLTMSHPSNYRLVYNTIYLKGMR